MDNRELFEAYNKDVYKTCLYMVRDPADAEDLCHDTFITAFRSRTDNIGQHRAWLIRIAVNQCLNHLRRKKLFRFKIESNLPRFAPANDLSAEQRAEERASRSEWAEVMKELPVKVRAVIVLRFVHDMTLSEVADTLSIPVGTVKSRLHKGLRQVKGILEKQERAIAREEDTREGCRAVSGTQIK